MVFNGARPPGRRSTSVKCKELKERVEGEKKASSTRRRNECRMVEEDGMVMDDGWMDGISREKGRVHLRELESGNVAENRLSRD